MTVDIFENVIDRDAAIRTLIAFTRGEETFEAAAMIRLWCGHSRPTNRHVSPGDEYGCLFCGRQVIERVDLISPTVFPHPDALHHLPEVEA